MTYRRPPAAPGRRGFTVVELIVVVAMIAVLGSLLLVGLGKMIVASKRQQTVALLHNCQALYAEYDAAAHPHFPVVDDFCPGQVTVDGNTTAAHYGRTGIHIQYTRAVFALMRTVPNVRAALDKVPPQHLMAVQQFTGVAGVPPRQYVWTPGTSYEQGYPPVCSVYVPDPANPNPDDPNQYVLYLCLTLNVAVDGSTTDANGNPVPANRPPDPRYWLPDSRDPAARVVTDAWGNPIMFCFGMLGTPRDPPVPVSARAPHKDDLNLYVAGQSTTVTSPDSRPFFAPAGPDGDFGAGDDNLYSFDR